FVLQELQNVTYKDEFEFLMGGDGCIKDYLGKKALQEFEKAAKERVAPREDAVFHALLREKLAIDPNGKHIEGAIGKVQVGTRPIAIRPFKVETLESIRRRKRLGIRMRDAGPKDREIITRMG